MEVSPLAFNNCRRNPPKQLFFQLSPTPGRKTRSLAARPVRLKQWIRSNEKGQKPSSKKASNWRENIKFSFKILGNPGSCVNVSNDYSFVSWRFWTDLFSDQNSRFSSWIQKRLKAVNKFKLCCVSCLPDDESNILIEKCFVCQQYVHVNVRERYFFLL